MVSSRIRPESSLVGTECVTVRRDDLRLALSALRAHAKQVELRADQAGEGWLGELLRSMLAADQEAEARLSSAL